MSQDQLKHQRQFANLAGREDCDEEVERELQLAGIESTRLPEVMRKHAGEVKTIVLGQLHGWGFTRLWRYWVCRGPGIPLDAATRLHQQFGSLVRVDGHCGCPSPLERFQGLGTGHYHVDTQEGLVALAGTIRQVVEEAALKSRLPGWPDNPDASQELSALEDFRLAVQRLCDHYGQAKSK